MYVYIAANYLRPDFCGKEEKKLGTCIRTYIGLENIRLAIRMLEGKGTCCIDKGGEMDVDQLRF